MSVGVIHWQLERYEAEEIKAVENLYVKELNHMKKYEKSEMSIRSFGPDEIADLSGKGLSNLDEAKESHITKEIKVLKVPHNQLTQIGFKRQDLLDNLQFLDISDNCITSFDGIEKYQNLILIDISKNSIEVLNKVDENVRLKRLLVSRNQIKRIDIKKEMKNLKVLDLHKNPIDTIDHGDMFPSVTELYVDECNLNSIKGVLSYCSLQHLTATQNGIEEDQPINHPTIIDCDMTCNKLTTVAPFTGMESLIYLNVTSNLIDDQGIVGYFPKLRAFRAGDNRISRIAVLLDHFPNLEILDLSRTNISSLDDVINFVSKASRLRFLDLRFTPITEDLYPDIINQEDAVLSSIAELDNKYSSTKEARNNYRQQVVKASISRLDILDQVKVTELDGQEQISDEEEDSGFLSFHEEEEEEEINESVVEEYEIESDHDEEEQIPEPADDEDETESNPIMPTIQISLPSEQHTNPIPKMKNEEVQVMINIDKIDDSGKEGLIQDLQNENNFLKNGLNDLQKQNADLMKQIKESLRNQMANQPENPEHNMVHDSFILHNLEPIEQTHETDSNGSTERKIQIKKLIFQYKKDNEEMKKLIQARKQRKERSSRLKELEEEYKRKIQEINSKSQKSSEVLNKHITLLIEQNSKLIDELQNVRKEMQSQSSSYPQYSNLIELINTLLNENQKLAQQLADKYSSPTDAKKTNSHRHKHHKHHHHHKSSGKQAQVSHRHKHHKHHHHHSKKHHFKAPVTYYVPGAYAGDAEPNVVQPIMFSDDDDDSFPYPYEKFTWLKHHPFPDDVEPPYVQRQIRTTNKPIKAFIPDEEHEVCSYWEEIEPYIVKVRTHEFRDTEVPPKRKPLMYPFNTKSPRMIPWDFSIPVNVEPRQNPIPKVQKKLTFVSCENDILKNARSPTPGDKPLNVDNNSLEFQMVEFWINVAVGFNIRMKSLIRSGMSTRFIELLREYKSLQLAIYPCDNPEKYFNTDLPQTLVVHRCVTKLLRPLSFLVCAVSFGKQAINNHPTTIPTEKTGQKLRSEGFDSMVFVSNGLESILVLDSDRMVPLYACIFSKSK